MKRFRFKHHSLIFANIQGEVKQHISFCMKINPLCIST